MQSSYDEKKEQGAFSCAGFWVRLFAWLIDIVIVGCGLLIVDLIMSGVMAAVSGTILSGNILFHYTLTDIVLYLTQAAYFILFTYYTGSTPGKRALNLRVVSAEEEEPLSFLNVVYRETIGRFLCAVTMGIGYLFVAVDGENRGLHDMLCDTRVIYAKRVKVYPVYYGRNVRKSGEDALRRGDFGGYRMAGSGDGVERKPEFGPIASSNPVPTVRTESSPEAQPEFTPDTSVENKWTERDCSSEDK